MNKEQCAIMNIAGDGMIRKIKEGDGEAIAKVAKEALAHDSSSSLIESRIKELKDNDNYFIYVYQDDSTNEVIGFIEAERYNLIYGGNGFNIIALAVDEDYRNKGVGRALVESLERYAISIGYTFIRLNSRIERADAHLFYSHIGYTEDKIQKRFIKRFGQKQ